MKIKEIILSLTAMRMCGINLKSKKIDFMDGHYL